MLVICVALTMAQSLPSIFSPLFVERKGTLAAARAGQGQEWEGPLGLATTFYAVAPCLALLPLLRDGQE